jgi:hypothetical protein
MLAVDLVGNIQLVPTYFSWLVDQTPPILFPILLPPLLNNFTTFNVSFTWSEELAYLWASTGGNIFQPLTVPAKGYTATVLVSVMSDGVHTLALKGLEFCPFSF